LKDARAEASANPFWEDPKLEKERLASVHEQCLRGGGENMLFFVLTTNDLDCVTYTFNSKADKTDEYVKVEWLICDPVSIKMCEKSLPAGYRKDDAGNFRKPLTFAQEPFLGVTMETETDDSGEDVIVAHMNVVESESLEKPLSMQVVNAGEQVICVMNLKGKPCRVDHVYVQMMKGIAPDVEFLRFTGTSMEAPFEEVEQVFEKPRALG